MKKDDVTLKTSHTSDDINFGIAPRLPAHWFELPQFKKMEQDPLTGKIITEGVQPIKGI